LTIKPIRFDSQFPAKDKGASPPPVTTDPNLLKLIWIFTGILLPLIPAILLFKLLPSSADVSGPFHGFQIKLGGAVAAYFLLVMVISFGPRPTPRFEVFTVRGQVQDENGDPMMENKIKMNIEPRSVVYRKDGSFDMEFMVKPNSKGEWELPTLNVDWEPPQLFGNAIVHLDPNKQRFGTNYKIENSGGQITIAEPIKLKKKVPETLPEAPYNPPKATPKPTALPASLADPTPTPTPTT
jgi:hypothetical protein